MVASVEFLHELVGRFEKAVAANKQTKGRKGSVVHLATADFDDLMVAGDLHGNRANYNRLLKAADLDHHPGRHLVLQEVVHGGPQYPGGGCMSHMLLEDVAALKARYPDRVHFLLCNHELAECLRIAITKAGVSQNYLFGLGLEKAYGPAAKRIEQCYHEFIRTCPLAIRLATGIFISHSIPDRPALKEFDPKVFLRDLAPADLLQGGSAYAVVWGRDHDNGHAGRFAQLVKSTVLIHGHEPTPEGYQCPNDYQLILDASGSECWYCLVPSGRKWTLHDAQAALCRLG